MTAQLGASSSSSRAPIQSWTYHVFLSFRGEDTRNTFTGHLRSYLVQKGIRVFIDDDGLPRGEEISGSLFKAIEESKISVIVFSENYAASKWCLEELVKIIHCHESKRQIVYPIFYKVDPSDVRNQYGSFGQALALHDNLDKVMGWKAALTKAGNLSGWHFSQGEHEAEFIQKIVEEISQKVSNLSGLNGYKYLVGIKSRLEDVFKLLCLGDNDVQMLGIWGIGGLGKTTIAKAVYDLIAHKFEGSCFVENVRERSLNYGGLQELQRLLLSMTLGLKELKINSIDDGSIMIKERLSHKRVFLVLDDVNDLDQLNSLARNSNWFGAGSRIIITTRDKHILHDVNQIYEVEKLNLLEALEVFKFHAFKGIEDTSDYIDLINDDVLDVICYSEGLPLLLEVMGSYLHGTSIDTWKYAIEYYKRNPKLHQCLKLSYDGLEPLMKEVFLHIACFFKGEKKNYVTDLLEGCDLPRYGIDVLIEKSLVRITEADDIWMHDVLQEMGKEIVFQESLEPGERSRLWLYEDVYHVFVHNTGTNKVKGIMVKKGIPHQQIPLNGESFLKLNGLQILQISGDIFCGDHVDYLPSKLSLLHWVHCPLQYFPPKFLLSRKLVVLKMDFISPWRLLKTGFLRTMPWICISPFGKGLQIMQNLKSIILRNCDGITSTSDFSRFHNLVKLNIWRCKNLVEVDLSIGFENLENLAVLQSGKVKKFEIVKEMKSLKSLDLGGTSIKELSFSTIGFLINLERLSLSSCKKLKHVPCNILELQHLKFLGLMRCRKLVNFPSKSEFSTESTSVQDKHYAPLSVHLRWCRRLVEITEFSREIHHLDTFQCVKLERISILSDILEGKELRMIPQINLSGCIALYPNLARDLSKMKKNLPDHSELTALFHLFFSCLQSDYKVLFYGTDEHICGKLNFSCRMPDMRIPKWFTCRSMDIEWEKLEVCNFRIDFPGNFKWKDKGLAFCASTFGSRGAYWVESSATAHVKVVAIYINGVSIIGERSSELGLWNGWGYYGFVWLYYMPFDAIIKRLSKSGLPPPSVCLIKFEFEVEYKEIELDMDCGVLLVNRGVHVVMPEDEGPFVNGVRHQLDNRGKHHMSS